MRGVGCESATRVAEVDGVRGAFWSLLRLQKNVESATKSDPGHPPDTSFWLPSTGPSATKSVIFMFFVFFLRFYDFSENFGVRAFLHHNWLHLAPRAASEAAPAGTFYAVSPACCLVFAFFGKSYVFCYFFVIFCVRPFLHSE